jgi:hypothetical protein
VLKNNITSVEHVFSSVHVSSRTSYCCMIQSVSQYILVAAVKTKPNKFQIQLIMNADFRVLVNAHFPVLCRVYGIFPFSRVLNFIVTNSMVHKLLYKLIIIKLGQEVPCHYRISITESIRTFHQTHLAQFKCIPVLHPIPFRPTLILS